MDNFLFFPENSEGNRAFVSAAANKIVTEKYAPSRSSNSSFYGSRRGGNFNVFSSWYYKCAEFASAQFLHEKFGFPFVEPDTTIYKSSQKGWSPDLKYENVTMFGKHFDKLRFHNKSVSAKSASAYSESFVFQLSNKDGKGGRDAIFDEGNENDYCIFVHAPYDDITPGRLEFFVRALLPWTFIKENGLLENLKKADFLGLKLCVYTESIRKKVKELEAVLA